MKTDTEVLPKNLYLVAVIFRDPRRTGDDRGFSADCVLAADQEEAKQILLDNHRAIFGELPIIQINAESVSMEKIRQDARLKAAT